MKHGNNAYGSMSQNIEIAITKQSSPPHNIRCNKGGPPEQKTIKRGNFSHVVRPPPPPPVWERPCHKKNFKVYFVF